MVVRPGDLPVHVSCEDAVGRRRQVVVAVEGRSVLLRVPPGELVVFRLPVLADELAVLRRALVAADALASTSSR